MISQANEYPAPPMATGFWMPQRTAAWNYKGGPWALARRFQAYPSWREGGYAYPCLRSLCEEFGVSRATMARWITFLVFAGMITRTWTMQGERLPNGRPSPTNRYVYRPGLVMRAGMEEAMQAAEEAGASSRAPDQVGGGTSASCRGHLCKLTHKQSPTTQPTKNSFPIEPQASTATAPPLASSPPAPPAPEGGGKKPLNLNPGEKRARVEQAKAARFAAPLLALALIVLKHYEAALKLQSRWFPAAKLAMVVQCIEDMSGDDEAKKERLKRVVDLAIADCAKAGREPTLKYIFGDLLHFRLRLRRLDPAAAPPPPVVNEANAARVNRMFAARLERVRAAVESGAEDPAVPLRHARELLARVTDRALLEAWSELAKATRAAPSAPPRTCEDAPRPAAPTPPPPPPLVASPPSEGLPKDKAGSVSREVAPSPIARETWHERKAREREEAEKAMEVREAAARARRDKMLAEAARLAELEKEAPPVPAPGRRELGTIADTIRAELANLGASASPQIQATLAAYDTRGPALASARPALAEKARAAS